MDGSAFRANAAGELTAPLINQAAIRTEYMNANARQLQAIYNYQRTVLNAFTEVVNRISKVENYRRSVALKESQVRALEESVEIAGNLFQAARPGADYVDVLFAQRDLLEARTALIETKQQQLSAIVNVYQALGGGLLRPSEMITEQVSSEPIPSLEPVTDTVPELPPAPPAAADSVPGA